MCDVLGTYGAFTGMSTAGCSGGCAAGYYGSSAGATSSTCDGPCAPGHLSHLCVPNIVRSFSLGAHSFSLITLYQYCLRATYFLDEILLCMCVCVLLYV